MEQQQQQHQHLAEGGGADAEGRLAAVAPALQPQRVE
jgi:hypothetical protein